MGSRLRPDPEKIFECLIEVSAPLSQNDGAKLMSYFPDNYEDVNMLKDVVPKFCFPFAHDAQMVDAVQHFAFVLTDIEGLYRFGFCRYPPKAKTCLCILSDLPAFEMFYGILNTLAELEINAGNECLTSKQFLDLVLESQVPEPGTKFTVSDPGTGWMKQYSYPDPEKLPSIPENRNLTDYFSAVNPNNMIALFASMMFERRIIVTSKKLSLLTACTYSASLLLYPMHWQHVFIPVIPPSLLDYCSAPMPFLVGVHSSLMEKVRDMPLDDVVILDVDKNEIELGFDDVDDLPSDAVSKLNNALKKNTIAIGEYVARAFLSAVVIMIGGYRDALKLSSDTIKFDQEMFLNSRPHMKSFLENLLKLQLFERFVHHRLEQLNSGEAIDDAFEEQVGLQTENDSKWVSRYNHWMKNRKRDGTQFLNNLSGKTGKARKFIHSGMKNVKIHGKNGFKEAMKGIKEKRKHFIEYSKGSDKDITGYDNDVVSPTHRSNSLPMRKVLSVQSDPKIEARKSVGSVLSNRINSPTSPSKSPKPARPPPKIPTNASPKAPPRPPPPRPSNPPPRRPSTPPPYKSNSVKGSPALKLRPSMLRNPGDPDVKDLINFYDQEERATESGPQVASTDPFTDFKEFDYLAGRSELAKEPHVKTNRLSTSDQNLNKDGLFDQTMCSLSDDTRQFLQNSRLMKESSENEKRNSNSSLDNEFLGSPQLRRRPPVKRTKKTLQEIAREQKVGNGHSLAHASSAPSLFDPLAGNLKNSSANVQGMLHKNLCGSSRNGSSNEPSGSSFLGTSNYLQSKSTSNSDVSSNVELLAQVELEDSRTNASDPFLELISQRHKPQQNIGTSQQNSWVAQF